MAYNPEAALIAEAEPDAVEQGVEAVRGGAFSLLAKPYSLPELSFQVKRALEGRSRRASPRAGRALPEGALHRGAQDAG
jgi:DNA-binding NtrC family response regulator